MKRHIDGEKKPKRGKRRMKKKNQKLAKQSSIRVSLEADGGMG